MSGAKFLYCLVITLACYGQPATLSPTQGAPPLSEMALSKVAMIEYPRLARVAQLQGTVRIAVTISSEGVVAGTRAISGPGILSESVRNGIAKWRFVGCSKGAPCTMEFEVRFELTGICQGVGTCAAGFEVEMPGRVRVISTVIPANIN